MDRENSALPAKVRIDVPPVRKQHGRMSRAKAIRLQGLRIADPQPTGIRGLMTGESCPRPGPGRNVGPEMSRILSLPRV